MDPSKQSVDILDESTKSVSFDRTKSSSNLKFYNISWSLVDKRNDRKREKQSSQVRANKTNAVGCSQNIDDLERIIKKNMYKGNIAKSIILFKLSHF